MLRSPVFFMNNLVACFLMPLILLFPILLQYEEMSLLFAQLGLSGMTAGFPVGVRRAHSGPGPCRVCHCDKRHFRLRHLPGRFQLYIQPFRARQDGHLLLGKLLPGLAVSFLSAALTLGVAFAVTGLSLAFVPYLLADLVLIVLCINLFGCAWTPVTPKWTGRRRQRLSSRIST